MERNRKWRDQNYSKYKAYLNNTKYKATRKNWYQKNKDEVNIYKNIWIAKNKEKVSAQRKIWYQKNKERLAIKNAKLYQ